ncbi:MAG: NADH-quinone oxidoreductase subunit L [Porphyromonadaceae bacterium]|nr:MAG: NADH-quinone oxidoreductase subunit L [Porphyromonadaceae bacterium]
MAVMNYSLTILILLIPFATFLFNGLVGMKFKPIVSGLIGTIGLGVITLLAYLTAWQYFFVDGMVGGSFPKVIAMSMEWLRLTDALRIQIGILLDPISVMMLVVITTVSFMVHIYSLGYMKGEKGFERFFSFLSLFSFSMLGLVIATNIFQMYIFWELVGVSSFLLIGFYYSKDSAVAASKKAFIVTRFADLGFLIGILLLSYFTQTFDFKVLTGTDQSIFAQTAGVSFLGMSVMTWAALLIFMGGAGKSAMFPLHIWLPDAMEGPTPVSALIHAATMVVAGVFLVARMFPVFYFQAPDALTVISYVGGFTSLFAAAIACTQYDIKRVLAFSTLSQIGYMMLALGVSGYGGHEGVGYMASMFHLFNHAMFKALLFLGAGSIIHAVHSNVMQDMGGLRKYLPITHITFLIACLTIAGVPFLSAFFSKDEILVAAYEHNKLLFAVEFLVAGLTAFYMFRLYFNIFWGKETHYHHTPHESPKTMTIPLMILALGSVFAGYIPFSKLVTSDSMPFESHMDFGIAIPSVLIGLTGILIAWILYKKESKIPERISKSLGGFYQAVYHKFYIDEVYMFITKKIIFNCIARPVAWFDRHIVDGTMNGIGWITVTSSRNIKGMQSGNLPQYGMVFVLSAIILVLIFSFLI